MTVKTYFEPHGVFNIERIGNIISIAASGAWNKEGMKVVICEILSSVHRENLCEWSLLTDIREFELGTPDFQVEGSIGKQKLVAAGLKKAAYICDIENICKIRQLQDMVPSSYQWKLFNEMGRALQWLQQDRVPDALFKSSHNSYLPYSFFVKLTPFR
ncbi:hypothetical protein ACO1HB_09805 [Alteromonas macleodii]|uniref:hypothetical protein n=1 Tax=Alteromonas macleodii TaxID=28108 RepID=UPI003BF91A44